jgi:hypothetical protein
MSASQVLFKWAEARHRYLENIKGEDGLLCEVMLWLAHENATAGRPMSRTDLRDAVKKALHLELSADTIDARIETLREFGYLVIDRSTTDRRKMIVTTSATAAAKLNAMDAELGL